MNYHYPIVADGCAASTCRVGTYITDLSWRGEGCDEWNNKELWVQIQRKQLPPAVWLCPNVLCLLGRRQLVQHCYVLAPQQGRLSAIYRKYKESWAKQQWMYSFFFFFLPVTWQEKSVFRLEEPICHRKFIFYQKYPATLLSSLTFDTTVIYWCAHI